MVLTLTHKSYFSLRIRGYKNLFEFKVIGLYGLIIFLIFGYSVYNFGSKSRCFEYFLSKFSKSSWILARILVFPSNSNPIFVVNFGYFALAHLYPSLDWKFIAWSRDFLREFVCGWVEFLHSSFLDSHFFKLKSFCPIAALKFAPEFHFYFFHWNWLHFTINVELRQVQIGANQWLDPFFKVPFSS